MAQSPVAVIAGSGRFPLHVARGAKRRGLPVVGFGMEGWADPALAAEVDRFETIQVGQLTRLIQQLKAHGVREAVMAGKVTKEVLLKDRASFDRETVALLAGLKDFSVASVLGAVGQRLAAEGITLLDSSVFVSEDLAPAGPMTTRTPTPAQAADITLGVRVACALAAFDVGQTVAVKDTVVVALEALEGTDAAIRRAGALAGPGLVIVKMGAPGQDRRFDLPVIGLETLAALREVRAACLAVEAGTVLLLDRRNFLEGANAANLAVVGISAR